MQSLTSAPSVTTIRTPLQRVLVAALVVLALGLWLSATVAPATPAEAEPQAAHSWVS